MKLGPEETLQADCFGLLASKSPKTARFWHTPNENKLYRLAKNRFALAAQQKHLGVKAGITDVIVVWGVRCGAFIELKAGTNKPEPEQLEFMSAMRALGFYAEWTNTLKGFVDHLVAAGLPLAGGVYAGRTGVVYLPFPKSSTCPVVDTMP